MWPLLIVNQVIGDMRPASATSEAIEAEVLQTCSIPKRLGWGYASAASSRGGVDERCELTAGGLAVADFKISNLKS